MSAQQEPQGAAVCPACAAPLAKMPQRKTKCRACGAFMYVRRSPDDATRRLLTEAQKNEVESAWRQSWQASADRREVDLYGCAAADLVEGESPDVDAAIERAHVLARGGRQTKAAVFGLYRSAATRTDLLAAHLALILIDLRDAQRIAFTAQLRCGYRHPNDHCAPCERLHDTIVSTDAPIEAVAPLDCPRLLQPGGRIRRGCDVMVQAWIRQPDGKLHLDRRPTPERAGPPVTPQEMEAARQAWSGVLGIELPKAEPPAAAPVQTPPAPAPAPHVPWWRRLFGLG